MHVWVLPGSLNPCCSRVKYILVPGIQHSGFDHHIKSAKYPSPYKVIIILWTILPMLYFAFFWLILFFIEVQLI